MGLYDRDYMRGDETGGYRRVSPKPWSPTVALLVVLLAVFFVQLLAGVLSGIPLSYQLGMSSGRGYPPDPFTQWFALSLAGIFHGHIWQLITFQFLHGGLLHIAVNGLTLYSFGRIMEQTFGRGRFLALYFLSGTLGGVLQIVASFTTALLLNQPSGLVVGASAGIAGLVGAFAMMYPQHRVIIFPLPLPIKAQTILWIAIGISVIGTIIPFGGVAHAAHLGGLLGGIAYVKYQRRAPRSRQSWQRPAARSTPPVIDVTAKPTPPSESSDSIASEVDGILDKINAHGIQSLTDRERKILEMARARMGKR